MGQLDVVKYLLSLESNIIDPTACDNDAIQCAAAEGHLDVIKLLVSVPGVDASANDNFAIKTAAVNDDEEMVKLLGAHLGFDEDTVESYLNYFGNLFEEGVLLLCYCRL
ncbi:hypothetical protein HDU76_005623 [Blyttiomyces sp. JEL0837]|nr:hypothetical protein HDU76_005623 [Blyttiomyces sp. JEL0837]